MGARGLVRHLRILKAHSVIPLDEDLDTIRQTPPVCESESTMEFGKWSGKSDIHVFGNATDD